MADTSTLIHNRSKEKYLQSFLLGFLCVFVSILPIIIADGGYFIYYGDYNAQQIHFYSLANDAVRDGQLGWNWFTDLGSDFLTSYSFYLSGSPFFWLTTILPKAWVIFAMPILLALKHALASLTAYVYIRKFVRNKNAALIGALLYSYSGFQLYNIFFNHFQDVTAFFPLMLIAMEDYINKDRKGIFALTVALMAVINYFFFTGQAVFLVIYYIVRVPCPDFKTSWKKFAGLAFEAVVGTMIAAFILVPSAMLILGNYRVSERLYGQDLVLYSDRTRIARIIQTFFMPTDVPARPNLFASDKAKWASIGGYLPLFSMVGVIAFMKTKKKHWATKLTLISILCAFIPVLNSMFYTFNGSYYARWFYMPILIFAMMTAYSLDTVDLDEYFGIKLSAGMLIAYAIISLLPKKLAGEVIVYFEFANNSTYFTITLIIAAVSLIVASFLIIRKRKGKSFMTASVWLTAAACVVCTLATVLYGATEPSNAKEYVDAAVYGGDDVYEEVSEDNFFRVDMSEDYDNYPMSWGLPSMRAFQSVVSPSIMEFYDKIGVQRDVASRADTTHYTLRGLLSVKYYYQKKDREISTPINEALPGFKLVGENDYFEIYENSLYIPMGFGYDQYITEEDADDRGDGMREKLLLNALVLSDKQIEKYSDILTEAPATETSGLTKASYQKACMDKILNSSKEFTYDSYGFKSHIELDKPQLVFFSVPYDKGWTAEVNGKPVDVEKVSYGFMAVRAEAGENVITFSYRTPGLTVGLIISAVGAVALIIYIIICRKTRKKSEVYYHSHYYDYTSHESISAAESYINRIAGNKADSDK